MELSEVHRSEQTTYTIFFILPVFSIGIPYLMAKEFLSFTLKYYSSDWNYMFSTKICSLIFVVENFLKRWLENVYRWANIAFKNLLIWQATIGEIKFEEVKKYLTTKRFNGSGHCGWKGCHRLPRFQRGTKIRVNPWF